MTAIENLKVAAKQLQGSSSFKMSSSLSEEDALKVIDAWETLEKELATELDLNEEVIRDALVDYFIGVEPEEL